MKSDSHLLPLHHALRGFARPSCTVPVEQQLHELQVMLAAGISPQSADADGLTPLEVAAQTGHSSAVHLLCAAEHAPPLEQCSRGLLHAVAFKGLSATKCDMIHTLARAGADVNHAGLSGEEKRPALHAAAETCPLDVVKALLDIQPDLNARWAGETALHVAARREKQNKSILEALLRAGCNPRSRTAPGGLTARELAAAAGNSKLAIVLAAAEAKAETDSAAGGHDGDRPGSATPSGATPASMRDNPAADDTSDQEDATLGSHLDGRLNKLQQQLTQQAAQLREREGQVQELQDHLAEATAQPSHGTKAQLQHSLMAAQVYADKASKAMHEIRLENATLRERLQASAAHQAADTAACQQLQDQLAGAQETQLQLEAQLAGRAQQMADVTGQLAEVQVQLEAAHPGREAQQAVQQEVAALREQLTVVQQERHAAAELQHQAAGQAALLRSREVEVESLRRMVRELQGMQRGADALRAADEARKREHEGELQQVEDGARQLRAALTASTAAQSCLEGQVAALQSDLAQARAELTEAVAGRLAAATASSTAELKAQALQRELASAAETRRQLHRRLQHDAQQHIKQNASLEAGTCKLREDLTAAQQKVKQLERHVQCLTGIDATNPRGCDQQALLTKTALDAALAAALHGTKLEGSEMATALISIRQ